LLKENYIWEIFSTLKEQIIESALKQFLKHGIRSMTMQKLSSGMGVSTKTLYKYFADKETLLEECLMLHYGAMEKQSPGFTDAAQNPVAFMCRVYAITAALDFGANHLFYSDLNHYYPELQDKVIGHFFGHIGSLLVQNLQAGIDNGYFLPQLEAEVVLQVLNVLYTSVTRYNSFARYKLKPADLVKHTIDIYLRGICTEKGLSIINSLNN
jgi:AcrR family transcriptional regulator